jgi:hypothetical protein
MTRFLIFAGALITVATTAMAAPIPACVVGTYASYEALTNGCVINNLLFSNFTDQESATGTAIALSATGITVTPDTFSLDEGLGFSAAWSVATPGSLDSVLRFTVQTLNGANTLNDIDLSFNGAVTGNGTSGVTETYCVGSTLGTAHCPSAIQTIAVSNPPGGNSGPIVQTFGATNSLSVAKDISVNSGTAVGGQKSTASITVVDNNYSQTVVPEPMSFVLLGGGLLGIGLLRKRTRR